MSVSTLKIGGMLLAVFLGGIFLRGEWARRQDLRRELDEIKTQQQQTMQQVHNINASYMQGRQELLEQTLQLYHQLDTIMAAKTANSVQIRRLDQQLDNRRQRIEVEIGVLKDLLKEGIWPIKNQ